jgi:hypothetical protein
MNCYDMDWQKVMMMNGISVRMTKQRLSWSGAAHGWILLLGLGESVHEAGSDDDM